ncbi:MAG: hypothetical protein KDC84_10430 [Crocinitomicaceae bacterium]|nr:hypothetical protein [Crocinitomicaceae bacterium]
MKFPLVIVLLFSLLMSCTNSFENSVKNEYDKNEWSEENRKEFLDKCLINLDISTCECVLAKVIETGKNILEVGQMEHNEFIGMAQECHDR